MSNELMRDRLHWLARAAEACALAEVLQDREAKQVMFEIARMYEQIAVRAQQCVAAEPTQKTGPWRCAS
jgi:hypothetical protein